MSVNQIISNENLSQKFNSKNIGVANMKPLNTPFDEFADLDNRKGDITVGFSVSQFNLKQTTEAHTNKLLSKTQNEDSLNILIENERIKASNLSEAKSKSTAAVQPPPGYSQPIHVCYLLKLLVCLFN